MADVNDERGFTLLEVVICIGLLAFVVAASVSMFAGVARRANPERTRDAAMMVAQNMLIRARAAASYAPSLPDVDVTSLRTFTDSRAWVLSPGTQTFVTKVKLVSAASICGNTASMTIPLNVTSDYEETSSPVSRTFTVTVTYPVNPCVPGDTKAVTLEEEIPAVAFAPGTHVKHNVNPPWGE